MEEPKVRYSDEELEEFRKIVLARLEVAQHDYDSLMEQLNAHDESETDEKMPTYHTLEEGSSLQSKETLMSMVLRAQKFVQGLKAALVRIDNKTYGVCRVTGKLIPKERLRLVPHATLTVEAKEMLAKSGKN